MSHAFQPPAVIRVKLFVTLEVQVALRLVVNQKIIAKLRPNANHAGLEAADPIAGPVVSRNFLVDVAHKD